MLSEPLSTPGHDSAHDDAGYAREGACYELPARCRSSRVYMGESRSSRSEFGHYGRYLRIPPGSREGAIQPPSIRMMSGRGIYPIIFYFNSENQQPVLFK